MTTIIASKVLDTNFADYFDNEMQSVVYSCYMYSVYVVCLQTLLFSSHYCILYTMGSFCTHGHLPSIENTCFNSFTW